MIGEVTVFQRSSSEHEVAEVIEWAREFIGTNGELDSTSDFVAAYPPFLPPSLPPSSSHPIYSRGWPF